MFLAAPTARQPVKVKQQGIGCIHYVMQVDFEQQSCTPSFTALVNKKKSLFYNILFKFSLANYYVSQSTLYYLSYIAADNKAPLKGSYWFYVHAAGALSTQLSWSLKLASALKILQLFRGLGFVMVVPFIARSSPGWESLPWEPSWLRSSWWNGNENFVQNCLLQALGCCSQRTEWEQSEWEEAWGARATGSPD